MLKQRVWAALVLILAFLAALFYSPPIVWAILMGAIALGAAWEWARLCGLSGLPRGLYALLVVGVIAAFYAVSSALMMQGLWLAALLFWFILAPMWLIKHWTIKHRGFLLFIGLIVLLPTWFAFVWLRDINALLLLFLMGLVWVADSAAYFSGRQWGKHKLAPLISPGKTWEGVVGALVVAILYVGLWRVFAPETVARFSAVSWWGQSLATMLLVAISITGDLFESHLKRVAGMKDSGSLIPGHGGILDRIDSQTSVLPVAMALIYFAGLGT
ncbi:MAG: phosphatidate cytidylyltransferase [Burkholderiales bacterium]|nr:phosphatidate cytidylyltransferase [Burkholderiales bacterium]